MTGLTTSRTPTADRVRQAADPALTPEERLHLDRQVGAALIATALLIVGWVYVQAFPSQRDVAALVLFVGALIAGTPVFQAALRSLRHSPHAHEKGEAMGAEPAAHHHGVMDQFVAIAVLAAIATGAYSTAILVPLLVALGHFLEERSVLGARAAMDGLKRLRSRDAHLLGAAGREEVVPVEELAVGDTIVVRPGDAFPADGRVLQGYSAVDQSAVTGETVPQEVGPESQVYAGTVNVSGVLRVRVTELGEQTAMGRVLEILKQAERSRAPITQLLERYTGHYMPFVLVLAVVTLLLSREVSRAVAVLVVACPCALVLSSSTAMIATLAVASRCGILIKSPRFLEVLAGVRSVVLDKTGTVTLGQLDVVGIHALAGVDEAAVLQNALLCARHSRHPLSQAIVREAGARGITAPDTVEASELPGRGVQARANGRAVRLGSAAWLKVERRIESGLQDHTGPVAWVEGDGAVLGAILLADRPRPEAREALDALRDLGISRTILLTGDRPEVAQGIAAYLNVDECHAGLLPADKLEIVEREVRAGRQVLAIGDGVNDAPALARADVGLAMGAMGSDAAIQSADVALMTNDLRRAATAIRLSRLTRRTININVAVGIASALAMIVMAALGYVGAIAGALLHNVGAAAVVLNSARLLRLDLE